MLLLAADLLLSTFIQSCLFTSPSFEQVTLTGCLKRFKYLTDLENSAAVSDICLNISETPLEYVTMFLSEPVLWTFFRCRVCAEKARIARIRTRKWSQIFPQLHCIQSKACSVTTTAGSHCAFTPTTVQQKWGSIQKSFFWLPDWVFLNADKL